MLDWGIKCRNGKTAQIIRLELKIYFSGRCKDTFFVSTLSEFTRSHSAPYTSHLLRPWAAVAPRGAGRGVGCGNLPSPTARGPGHGGGGSPVHGGGTAVGGSLLRTPRGSGVGTFLLTGIASSNGSPRVGRLSLKCEGALGVDNPPRRGAKHLFRVWGCRGAFSATNAHTDLWFPAPAESSPASGVHR